MQRAYDGPHKDNSINMCVRMCVRMAWLLSTKSVVLATLTLNLLWVTNSDDSGL